MSKAFSIVRAIIIKNAAEGLLFDIADGKETDSDNVIKLLGNDTTANILPGTKCYNTAMVDGNGDEIFEGDYLREPGNTALEMVVFDEQEGAFFTVHTETLYDVEVGGAYEEIRYCEYPNATVFRRLPYDRARLCRIEKSMLEDAMLLASPTPEPSDDEPDPDDDDSVELINSSDFDDSDAPIEVPFDEPPLDPEDVPVDIMSDGDYENTAAMVDEMTAFGDEPQTVFDDASIFADEPIGGTVSAEDQAVANAFGLDSADFVTINAAALK